MDGPFWNFRLDRVPPAEAAGLGCFYSYSERLRIPMSSSVMTAQVRGNIAGRFELPGQGRAPPVNIYTFHEREDETVVLKYCSRST